MEKRRHYSLSGHSSRAILPSLNLAISLMLPLLSGCRDAGVPAPEVPSSFGGDLQSGTVIRFDADVGGHLLTKADSWQLIRHMDVFVFEDDRLSALDSYTCVDDYGLEPLTVPSSGGAKIVVALANYHMDKDLASWIGSLSELEAVACEFCSDNPDTPVMTGTGRFTAGTDRSCQVTLSPLMSRVEISSLRCEISGASLKELKVYLTGVSNRAKLLQQDGFLPSEILNHLDLNEKDLLKLPYSSMVYRYLGNGTKDSGGTEFGMATLYCYPNQASDNTMGSPQTTLVIEGLLNGSPRRWTIPVNQGPGYNPYSSPSSNPLPGIGRNRCYSYKIRIQSEGEAVAR